MEWKVERRAALAVAAMLLVASLGTAPLSGERIELKAVYRAFDDAPECEKAITKRFQIQGPGEVTILIRLQPYRSAGKVDLIPVQFGEYRNGTFQGWEIGTPFVWISSEVTQLNQPRKGNYVEGAPLEKVSHYRLEARKYDVEVRLSPPCMMEGSAGFRQWSQVSEVVIETSSSGSTGSPPPPPPTTRLDLSGRWQAFRDGSKVADCSIQQDGGKLTFIIHRTPEERSSGRFLDEVTVSADDWGLQRGRVSADGRRIDWQGSHWVRVDDGAGSPPPPVTLPNLSGRWQAFRGGSKVADCSIQQDGGKLTFIIHRSPEERSSGRFLDDKTVSADEWGPQRGRVSADGRRIEWENSYWQRTD